jgi:hypothetical protein
VDVSEADARAPWPRSGNRTWALRSRASLRPLPTRCEGHATVGRQHRALDGRERLEVDPCLLPHEAIDRSVRFGAERASLVRDAVLKAVGLDPCGGVEPALVPRLVAGDGAEGSGEVAGRIVGGLADRAVDPVVEDGGDRRGLPSSAGVTVLEGSAGRGARRSGVEVGLDVGQAASRGLALRIDELEGTGSDAAAPRGLSAQPCLAASSAWCLATMSSTAFMLLAAKSSRDSRARCWALSVLHA